MLSHVVIGRDGRVTWERHSVFAQELAERLVRVSSLACSWLFEVSVEECEGVNVFGCELRTIDLAWGEKSGSLVHCSNVG